MTLLKEFGLGDYEARLYFTLLTIGEAKAGVVTRKASVPPGKVYDVLDNLMAKGFVELSRKERQKEYRAINLRKITDRATERRQRQIRELKEIYGFYCLLLNFGFLWRQMSKIRILPKWFYYACTP